MTGTPVLQRTTGRTVLALFAILSLLLSMMALFTVQPVQAITSPAVLALSEDCEQTALHKQIDVSGSDLTIEGDVHSNAGITVSGANNHADGAVTFDDEDCDYVIPDGDNGNTGGFTSESHAASMADPNYAQPSGAACTFDFTGREGEPGVDLNNEDVWADANTLMTGTYCHDGLLQQSRQNADGEVSFYSTGYIDLSNGSNNHYTPARLDGVLLHSENDGFDAVKVAGSNSSFAGIIYAPNGEGEVSGQFITTGCIVAETVKLDGSDNTIGDDCQSTPPDPTVSIAKTNSTEPDGTASPGDSVDFTLTVTIADSNGEDVTVEDFIPAGFDDPDDTPVTGDIGQGGSFDGGGDPAGDGGVITWTIDSPGDGEHTLTYTLTVSDSITEDTLLENTAVVTYPGSNCPPDPQLDLLGGEVDDPCDDDSVVVVVVTPPDPLIEIVKENDTDGSVAPGDSVDFTLTVTITDSNGEDVTVEDFIPAGFDDPAPTDIDQGGSFDGGGDPAGDGGIITWTIESPGDGEHELTYTLTVSESITEDTTLENTAVVTYPGSNCPDDAKELFGVQGDDPCDDDSTVVVDVPPLEPALVIDKVASTETITISGPNDALVANPSVVTWTLTYTLTNGPVDNAVITDEIPVGFVFLDASPGGTETDGTVTWTFEELTTSGSVSFRTTVDPVTLPRTPTTNVAVIDSDDTPPDEGPDTVTVVVIPPVLGGNPTPEVPDTALGLGLNGEPVTVPIELLATLFLGSLGALALANVRSWSSRRR